MTTHNPLKHAMPRSDAHQCPGPDRRRNTVGRAHRLLMSGAGILARITMKPIARLDIGDLPTCPQPGEGAIIVANHRSLIDFAIALIAFRQWRLRPHIFIRADFLNYPVIGRLLQAIGAIPAQRGGGGGGIASQRGHEILGRSRMIAMTPEGRIPHPSERIDGLGQLRGGVGRLAVAHATPILLTGMINTDDAWPLDKKAPRFRLRSRPTIHVMACWMTVLPAATDLEVVQDVGDGLRRILADLESEQALASR